MWQLTEQMNALHQKVDNLIEQINKQYNELDSNMYELLAYFKNLQKKILGESNVEK